MFAPYLLEILLSKKNMLFYLLAQFSNPIHKLQLCTEKKHYSPFDSYEWLAPNFSLQYQPLNTYQGHENTVIDQLKKLLIIPILLVSILGNVSSTW